MKKAINYLGIAKNNFALAISNGESFKNAIESGALMLDTDEELEEYSKFCAGWKAGQSTMTVEMYDVKKERFYTATV